MATNSERIHGGGAEVIAISVNEEERQAGMFERWKTPNVLYVSDPGGETYLQALDLYDPDERGGIALPGMLVIGPDGEEAYRYQGRDFADRTTDDDVYAALDALALDPVEPPVGGPSDISVPEDLKGFFPPSRYPVYFAGNRFGAIAIGGRLEDPASKAIAREHRIMAERSLEAWEQLNS